MSLSFCSLAAGELRTAPLASILIEALRMKATGELVIGVPGGTSRTYFRDGQPCGVQVFFGFKPLGQFLLELGWIDLHALERSLMAVADGRKQGEALVSLGLLTSEQLEAGLALLHRNHLRTLAALKEGTYAFEPTGKLPGWTNEIRLGAHRAIVDAMMPPAGRWVAQRIIQDGLPAGQKLRLRQGWERFASHFELSDEERAFAARLAEPRWLQEVLVGAEIEEARALALIAAFVLMGVALPHREVAGSAPTIERTVVPGSENGASAMQGATPILERSGGPVSSNRERSGGPPGSQGMPPILERSGGPAASRSAGPSAPILERSGGPSASRSAGPSAPILERSGGPSASRSAGPSAPILERSGSPSASRSAGPAGASASNRAEDDRSLEEAIEKRHAAIGGDHFARLGLNRKADAAQIKQAFLQSVRLFHPDRLRPGLAHLAPKVQEIFGAVTEANEVLSDEGLRRAYLGELEARTQAGGGIRSADVRQLAKKGEELIRQKRFSQALAFFMQALQMEEHPELRAHVIWAANADPSRPAYDRARRELESLKRRHPECMPISHYLNALDLLEGNGLS